MVEVSLLTIAMIEDGSESMMVLKEVDGARALVIGIGVAEASAIALEMEEVVPPRPMTHDLLLSVVSRLRGRVERVLIHDLEDDVFLAQIELMTEDGIIEVDARPSDCVAVAVRARAPILVSDEVMDEAGFIPDEDGWMVIPEGDDGPDDTR